MSEKTTNAFFGLSAEADFSRDYWSFEMDPGYKVRAGRYAIVPERDYAEIMHQRDALLAAIEPLRAKFRSGNEVPVERAMIRADEWAAVEAAIAKATGSAQ